MTVTYVYPADEYGCGFYRLIAPAKALKAAGHDVRIKMPSKRDGIGAAIDTRTGQVVDVTIPEDADCIVLQRISLAHLVQAVPLIRARGVAVVIDIDDDLTKIDPNNPAFAALHPKGGDSRHTWKNLNLACRTATMVTVSTPQLLSVYAPHGRGMVLENRVPEAYLTIPHDITVDSIGWAGSVHSHPFDLHEVGFSVQQLLADGHTYRGVGPSEGLAAALGLKEDPPVTGSVELHEWADTIATHIGVGIAPLADTLFNAAKSWLKPLEMSALGVPWVASPRAEYKRLAGLLADVGLFADKPRDWLKQIRRLVTNQSLRAEQSAAGRAAAADWTIEGGAWRWAEAWQQAIEMQRKGTRLTVGSA